MKHNTSRTIIETTIRKAITTIRTDQGRGLRNLVDMALQLSKGRFQQDFFGVIQTMLKNTGSAYYALSREIITHTAEENLITFGMNIGYNSCTFGANRIRENERALGHMIPWTIALRLPKGSEERNLRRYHTLIGEGEELGIYTWQLFVQEDVQPVLDLAGKHPDSAFLLFCSSAALSEETLDALAERKNLMAVVRCGEGCKEACGKLRERELLYSVFHSYTTKDLASVINGEVFAATQELGAAFTFLIAEQDCPEEIRKLVYQEAVRTRTEQNYRTLVMELDKDCRYIDRVISDDSCVVSFDEGGHMYDGHKALTTKDTLFDTPLRTLLKEAFGTAAS